MQLRARTINDLAEMVTGGSGGGMFGGGAGDRKTSEKDFGGSPGQKRPNRPGRRRKRQPTRFESWD